MARKEIDRISLLLIYSNYLRLLYLELGVITMFLIVYLMNSFNLIFSCYSWIIFKHLYSSNECNTFILICTYSCSKIEIGFPWLGRPFHDNNTRTVLTYNKVILCGETRIISLLYVWKDNSVLKSTLRRIGNK